MRFNALLALIFTLFCLPLMAQYNYSNEWQKVTELDLKGLPKSALEVVEGIYRQALKDGREPHQVKALIYRLKYYDALAENSSSQNLQVLNQEITRTKGAARALVQSIKAQMLWEYMQFHRYQLYSRTALANDTSTDIETWGQDRLGREISDAYLASLENAALLQQTQLAAYEDVLEKGNARVLRPTLYDLLAHRALDYLKSGDRYLNQPANLFELEDPQAFAPAATFAAHAFKVADTTSQQFLALQLLQDLIRFHIKDNSRAALLDVDLERIRYMYQVGVMADKETLYEKALQQMQQEYAQETEVTEVMHLLAQLYYQQDQQNDSATGKAALAVALCNKAIEQSPKSHGAIACKQLLASISARTLGLETELVNLPEQPFRTLVTYRNTQKIYLRIAAITEGFRKQLRDAQNDYRDTTNRYWRLITGRPAAKEWEQALPDPKDYRQHTVEIKGDAQPLGQYMLLASTEPGFSTENSILAVQFIHVSQISYISRGNTYLLLHRETGRPLEGVRLNIQETFTNVLKDGGEVTQIAQSYVSDKNGRITMDVTKNKNNRNVRLEWILGKDVLYPDNYKYLYRNAPQQRGKPEETKSFLFTDRAIYRPGQTVYFKGIVVKQNNTDRSSQALAAYKTKVLLKDANGEEVDSLDVTSNEYGSYAGKFQLPASRLNGAFSITDDDTDGSVGFSVEEYKRPKFYVEFDTVKGSYKVGDTITVHGKALAYAGNNIDGAQVKYRIVREARFPYYWMFYFRPGPTSASREIASGQVETAADGSFSIPFTALPDKQIKPEQKPIFTYRVYADVTDLNGETRSGDQRIAAGYQLLEVKLDIPETLQSQDLKKVAISTANLNGAFEPAAVKLRLLPLQHPGRLIRPRYWNAPDQFVMTEEEFVRNFPLDVYKHEDEPAQWIRGAAVLERSFTTIKDSAADLSVKSLPQGWYELEVSATDRLGAAVVQKKVFRIWDAQAKSLPYPAYLAASFDDKEYEPGTQAQTVLASTAKDLYIWQTTERWDQRPADELLHLSNQQQAFPYAITEKDRGGLQLEYNFVKDNRVFSWQQRIDVPWSNKTLELTLGTHRDKLQPGEKRKMAGTNKRR